VEIDHAFFNSVEESRIQNSVARITPYFMARRLHYLPALPSRSGKVNVDMGQDRLGWIPAHGYAASEMTIIKVLTSTPSYFDT
jgi:hypothetical protein